MKFDQILKILQDVTRNMKKLNAFKEMSDIEKKTNKNMKLNSFFQFFIFFLNVEELRQV